MTRQVRARKPRLFEPPAGLEFENALFDHLTETASPPFADIFFWHQKKCLVLPRRWTEKPGFEVAAEGAMSGGWPIFPRRSGGSCVFHGQNVLCITSILCTERHQLGIRDVYTRFCNLVIDSLKNLYGVEARYGGCPDAPCDGDFNILIGHRKLAGTAMRRRSTHGKDTFLVHGVIWLEEPLQEPLCVIEAFDRAMGLDVHYPPEACITLQEAAGDVAGGSELGILLDKLTEAHADYMLSSRVIPPSTTRDSPVI